MLQIGRQRYRFVCRTLLDGEAGECDDVKKIICIHKEHGSKDDVLETIIHEIFHGECAESGVRQIPGWSLDMEEVMAENIAQSLVMNMPQIRAFIDKHFDA